MSREKVGYIEKTSQKSTDLPKRGIVKVPKEPKESNTTASEEEILPAHIRERGSINNAECRELLGVGMHRAWYLLRKLHRSGKLKQDSTGRWAHYRLAGP